MSSAPTGTAAAKGKQDTTAVAGGDKGGGEGEAVLDLYVARQPIFDRQRRVHGYELLFRSGMANAFSHTDGSQATRQTVNTTLNVMGLERLVGSGLAFVNVTRDLLLSEFCHVLPAKRTVVELLEDIEIDDEVVAACRRLKEAGYTLALDDFVFQKESGRLLAMADMVKVDLTTMSLNGSRALMKAYGREGLTFLAEKVETHEELEQAVRLGYSYFQGYFFCKPEVMTDRDIPASKQHCLMFLSEVARPELDYAALEKAVRLEPSLSVKLLRYINANAHGMSERVESIRQGLALVGEKALRQWGSLVVMTCLGEDKPAELVRLCLVRARFCELIGELALPRRSQVDLFLMGLLSMLDALLDRPLADVLPSLPVGGDIKAALLGESSELSEVQMLAAARERGQWQQVSMLSKLLGIGEPEVSRAYAQASAWAEEAGV